jgi:hypothetical protein
VDPVELERSEIIATAALLYLSDLTEQEAVDLVFLVSANSSDRLGEAALRGLRTMRELPDFIGPYQAFFEARNIVVRATEVEKAAVSSVLLFNDAPAVQSAVRSAHGQIEKGQSDLIASLREQANLPRRGVAPAERTEPEDRRVPVRLTRGPLDFGLPASKLSDEAAAWYSSSEFRLSGSARFELVNFIDGKRTVTQIRDAIAAEFGPVTIAMVGRYLDDLVTVGAIEWKQ